MRRTVKITVALAAASLIATSCAQGDEGPEATQASEDICETAEGDGPQIGLAYDVGGRGDQSFNDSAYEGLKQAVEELDATCTEAEAGPGENDATREERLRTLADEGFDPIIGVGFIYSVAAQNVAKEPDYRDVNFAVVDGFAEAPNVANLVFAAQEGSFLVGAAAALKTEVGHVGFVGGVDGPLIQSFEAGFVAGVEEVDPSIQIDIKYLTQNQDEAVKGFENPPGGRAAANGMYESGADIVYHAAGKSGLGVFQAVESAGDGHWAIGVDSDQYKTVGQSQKPYILTSMLKRVDVGVQEYIKAVVEGDAPSGFVTYDLSSDGVGYSTTGGFVDDIAEQLDEYKQQIIDGGIKVPDTP
ncbi:MAG: BMP family ABC transporter substrate-binding protein [Propionibacteriales bacterium]|nr:BMP family ABC transporter substrate-binding protein [Propionibacteriales bacterium]